jgi:hypothetical protein
LQEIRTGHRHGRQRVYPRSARSFGHQPIRLVGRRDERGSQGTSLFGAQAVIADMHRRRLVQAAVINTPDGQLEGGDPNAYVVDV